MTQHWIVALVVAVAALYALWYGWSSTLRQPAGRHNPAAVPACRACSACTGCGGAAGSLVRPRVGEPQTLHHFAPQLAKKPNNTGLLA